MPSVIDWNSVDEEFKNSGSGKASSAGQSDKVRIPFLKFQKGKTHIFRPFGPAIRFHKFFLNNKRTVVVEPEDKDAAAKIISECVGKEIKPELRFAMFIIDRDDQEIKVLEGNFGMLKAFSQWATLNKCSPGSKQGGDWSIMVKGEGIAGPDPRRYQTGFVRTVPVTDAERNKINAIADKLKLNEIFPAIPINKLAEKIHELNSSTSFTSSTAVAEKAKASSNDDLAF